MNTVSLFDAKTHLSRIIESLLNRETDDVIISRRGKPVAELRRYAQHDVSQRIGIAKGEFDVPDDIDASNPEVAMLFNGGAS